MWKLASKTLPPFPPFLTSMPSLTEGKSAYLPCWLWAQGTHASFTLAYKRSDSFFFLPLEASVLGTFLLRTSPLCCEKPMSHADTSWRDWGQWLIFRHQLPATWGASQKSKPGEPQLTTVPVTPNRSHKGDPSEPCPGEPRQSLEPGERVMSCCF
jgi:hypothetical protein